jgi:hypothetical protein
VAVAQAGEMAEAGIEEGCMQKVTQAKSLIGTDGAVPENPKQQEAECSTETTRHHRPIRVEAVVCRALVRDVTATDSNRTNRWSGQASMVGDPKVSRLHVIAKAAENPS